MKTSTLLFVIVITVASMASSCFGQIHYTPGWGNGKRSLLPQLEEGPTDGLVQCLEQTELNLLLEVAKALTKEARKLSNCWKDCPSLE